MKKILLPLLLTLAFIQKTRGQEMVNIPQTPIFDGNTKKKLGTQYGGIDVIYGNVKRMVQTRYSIGANKKNHLLTTDTTNYNDKGDITSRRLGIGFYKITSNNKVFDLYEMYDRQVEPVDTTDKIVDHFDMNGNSLGFDCYSNNGKLKFKKYYNYDIVSGNLIHFAIYNSKDSITLKKIYKYKKIAFVTGTNSYSNSILNEVDDYTTSDRLKSKILFTYKIFDKKGNWISANEIWKSSDGIVKNRIAITRKITYY